MLHIKRLSTQVLAGTGIMLCAALAQAGMVFSVSDTSVVNCSDAPHGLWTGSDIGGGDCSNYFSIESGYFTVNDDDTGTLKAKANNPDGLMANIDLGFGGFSDTLPEGLSYKQEGGGGYDPATDDPNVDFYQTIWGTITIDGYEFSINEIVDGYAFQFGQGANAKDASEFGASAWIVPTLGGDYTESSLSSHWDLNLKLTKVPEPGTLAMLLAGLLSLVVIRRRMV